MPVCICGFSQNQPNCDGTHRLVKAIRESIAQKIEEDSTLTQEEITKLAGLARKNKRGY